MTLLDDIAEIVRETIVDGLLDEDLTIFDFLMETLPDHEKEDYLQTLWDNIYNG